MKHIALKKNTTDQQCAGFVASIGCPRRLELCNDFGRRINKRRRFQYDHEIKPWGERFDRSARIAADQALHRWIAA